jgi:hypothetical protein
MDYEKKYKEALEVAQKLYQDCPNGKNDRLYHTTDLEKMFPELKESEDERIKKEIISFIQDAIDEINLKVSGDYNDRDEDDIAHQNWCKKAIAWLENIPYTIDHEKREGFHLGYKTALEKQGEKPSAIRWYDASLIPQEMEELLVEWESEDATWHEIAFYHADTKTFWDGTRQVKNVTRWCYIIDLLEKQAAQKPFDYENANIQQKDFAPQVEQKLAWGEEDECYMSECIGAIATKDGWSFEEKRKTKHWLKSLKNRIKGE